MYLGDVAGTRREHILLPAVPVLILTTAAVVKAWPSKPIQLGCLCDEAVRSQRVPEIPLQALLSMLHAGVSTTKERMCQNGVNFRILQQESLGCLAQWRLTCSNRNHSEYPCKQTYQR